MPLTQKTTHPQHQIINRTIPLPKLAHTGVMIVLKPGIIIVTATTIQKPSK